MLEELRPVRLEVARSPQVGDEWNFQLVRRTGDNIGLPWQQPGSELTQEGAEGWHFARRVRGSPVTRLSLIHNELLGLEAAIADTESGLERSAAAPLITKLQEQLLETSAAAAAAEAAGARGPPGASARNDADASKASTVVFYQSADGQLVFLEPFLTKQLLATHGSWAALPECLTLKSLTAVSHTSVTDDLLHRHRFLAHLAVGGEVIFVDGELEKSGTSYRSEEIHASGLGVHRRGGRGTHSGRRGHRNGYGKQQHSPVENVSKVTEIDKGTLSIPPTVVEGIKTAAEEVIPSPEAQRDGWDD